MKKPRLRLRLLLLGLPAALPALLALLYIRSGEGREAANEELDSHLRVTTVAAARVAGTLDGVNRTLATLGTFPGFLTNDRAQCERILRMALAGHSSYVNLAVFETDGSLVCAAKSVDARK